MRRHREKKIQELIQDPAERERQKRERTLKWKKILIGFLWGAAGILLLTVLGFALYQWKIRPNKRYSAYETISSQERNDGADTIYEPFGGYILKYNRDGVSVLDGRGTILWNAAYNMQNPKAVTAGSFVAVADIGNSQLTVYNEKGLGTELDILSDILQVSISEQGEVAVLMQEKEAYRIQVIDPYAAGKKEKAEIYTYVEESGYALGIALSKDGAKLVTSFFQPKGTSLASSLTFYSFNSYGQGANADRIVGIFPYEDTLFPTLEFMDNDTVCVCGDDRLLLFSMRQKPELVWEKEHGRVQRVLCSGDYVMLIEESEKADAAAVFRAYEKSGKNVVQRNLGFSVSGLGQLGGDFWLYSEKECLILRTEGKVKFEGEFHESVQAMSSAGTGDGYFIVTGDYIEEIKLKEKTAE